MQDDENRASDRLKIGEILLFPRDETHGRVCTNHINDTPGMVDINPGGKRREDGMKKP